MAVFPRSFLWRLSSRWLLDWELLQDMPRVAVVVAKTAWTSKTCQNSRAALSLEKVAEWLDLCQSEDPVRLHLCLSFAVTLVLCSSWASAAAPTYEWIFGAPDPMVALGTSDGVLLVAQATLVNSCEVSAAFLPPVDKPWHYLFKIKTQTHVMCAQAVKPPIWVTLFAGSQRSVSSVWVTSAGHPSPISTEYAVLAVPQSAACSAAAYQCKVRKPTLLSAFSTDKDVVTVAWVSVNEGCHERAYFEPAVRMPYNYSVTVESPKPHVPPVLCSTRPVRKGIFFSERFSGTPPASIKVKVSPTETDTVSVSKAFVPPVKP